jgi:hypothetical protein
LGTSTLVNFTARKRRENSIIEIIIANILRKIKDPILKEFRYLNNR